ncbi:unnamed protein product [Owenia fusiformis]|uniref:Cytochrome P450 n=1 Tax=Owenia fusiformis TaxID=6347 RepID=A0A8S4NS05_OWEFU|nr:unnamed protein product [Owenia fusiformis]
MGLLQVLIDTILDNLTTILIFSIVFFILYRYLQPSPYRFPPGPRPWPLIGNLGLMAGSEDDPSGAKRIWEISKEMNTDMLSVYLGGKYPAMMLHKYEDIKELFSMPEFSGRQFFEFWEIFMGGLIGATGARWKEQRRFALSTLRNFGLGKNKLEEKIDVEIEYLCQLLDSYNGEAKDLSITLKNAVSNIICSLIFGHRFDYEDATFKRMLNLQQENFDENLLYAGIATIVPGARYLPGDFFRLKRANEIVNELRSKIFKAEYDDHMAKFDPNNIGDYIDAFILEMKERAKRGSEEEHWFNEKQLNMSIEDMFQAGTETTTSSLIWIIVYMLHYPEVQERMRSEIHSVIGLERMPSMRDKTMMPYTEAVMSEIQRQQPGLPISVGNCTHDAPVEVKGFLLPPNTTCYGNFYAIHNDPDYWSEPEKFKPERFMDENNKFVGDKRLMTFSTGTRTCIGESLARMELFLFATAILQRYKIVNPEGAELPSLIAKRGSSLFVAKPFKVRLVRI